MGQSQRATWLSIERDLGIGAEATDITADQVIVVLDLLESLGTLNSQHLDTLALPRADVVSLTCIDSGASTSLRRVDSAKSSLTYIAHLEGE